MTVIPFTLQTSSSVELIVYNLSGEKVQTLIDEHYQSGMYQVQINADEWPSGLYYYELKTSHQILRNKCLLIK